MPYPQHLLVAQCRLDTPLGTMTAAATPRGLAGLWFDGQAHHPGPLAAPTDPTQPCLQAAARALAAYFGRQAAGPAGAVAPAEAAGPVAPTQPCTAHHAGTDAHAVPAWPTVPPWPPLPPLDLLGTPFQRRVWQALLAIAPGHSRSYGQLAQTLGMPAAVRAVGAAVGRNPVSVLVPCHRVLGQGGQLTGYAGGLHRKQALLAQEGVAHR